MNDQSNPGSIAPPSDRVVEIKKLAARAIEVLANRAEPQPDETKKRLEDLCAAYVSQDEKLRHEAIARLLHEGVTADEIVTSVIPDAARLLGQKWGDDEMSFVEVTIGTARMQETVRALLSRKEADADDHMGTVLLVLPYTEEHTLGTFVAAELFRRQGYEAHISVADSPQEIANRVARHRYHMIGVTASGRKSLASIKDIVDTLRKSVPRLMPVVVGGSILDYGHDIVALTGADHATCDPVDALKACGLPLIGQDVELRMAL